MEDMPVSSRADFESLPPAVQRKGKRSSIAIALSIIDVNVFDKSIGKTDDCGGSWMQLVPFALTASSRALTFSSWSKLQPRHPPQLHLLHLLRISSSCTSTRSCKRGSLKTINQIVLSIQATSETLQILLVGLGQPSQASLHPRHHAQPVHESTAKLPLPISHHSRARIITPSSSTSSLAHQGQQKQRSPRQKLHLRRISPLTARRGTSNRLTRLPVGNDLALVNEYLQCFHSLPPKIQKVIFSPEEQQILQRIAPTATITDAADRALFRLEERRRTGRRRQSLGTVSTSSDRLARRGRRHRRRSRLDRPSSTIRSSLRSSVPSSLPSTSAEDPFADTTDAIETTDTVADPNDSGIEMEESILDSFRWLDEDEELDLSLDSYHKYVADTALSSQHVQQSPRRMPSFRRTLSLAKNRNSIFMGSSGRGLSSSQSSTLHFSAAGSGAHNNNNRTDNYHGRHAPHRSTSSIDPAAQYYQDPEARLKLRVYLASPQKFDEAIEFGFPSLDKENSDTNNPRRHNNNRDSKRISQISASTHGTHGWTFLDDDTSIDLSLFDLTDPPPQTQQSKKSRRSHDKTTLSPNIRELTTSHSRSSSTIDPHLHRRPHPLKPIEGNVNGNPRPATGGHRREMTLKMTLTRPDLRTASDIGPYGHDRHDDPLRLAELPPADESCNIWDDIPEEKGVVKKMWRKLRSWRD
ncbi:hypothetical protein TSTA_010550 [Talaromyces stipitatus ATCC 10500]|uniref:Mucin n=1 Tax=Talaromyces stipitatus (strain ATCC 10500 / CBS 375.48 / QM 6759 / NRRL 1006) TaxID=441959 RepID=B8MG71_TALSN|nr:uncharacterized protein TSTA_010550 [Talaromyces stipitatus ATCC 10500]EED15938.1 hypothetical protein TSTA_010550 [Talaromyces stipitatus ATCC 10500]